MSNEKQIAQDPNRQSQDYCVKANQGKILGGNSSQKSLEESIEVTTTEYASGFKLGAIVLALLLAVFLFALDMTIVATAIPKITDDFHSLGDVSWYGSAFFMTCAGFLAAWGKAYKYFPLKWAFLLSVFVFEVGSLICGVAPNSSALIAGRAIAGVGAAGLSSGAYTIVGFASPPAQRPLFTNIIGASYGIASVVGPVIGGALSANTTWRWCFYINLPIGGVAAAIILIFFHAPKEAAPTEATYAEKLLQIDPIGIALIIGSLTCFILAFQYGGQTHPWHSSIVIGLLVGFVLLAFAFTVSNYFQSKNDRAILPPRLMTNYKIWPLCLFTSFNAGVFFLVIYLLPLYFQTTQGASPITSGVHNLPLILPWLVASIAAAGVMQSTGYAKPILIFGAMLATVGTGLFYTLSIGSSTGKWVGYQILAGVGWGASIQFPMIMAQSSVQSQDLSMTTAIILFFQTVGGAILISAGQGSLLARMISELPKNGVTISPSTVIAAGATGIRQAFPEAMVPGILKSYVSGLRVAFAIAIGCMGVAVLASFIGGWGRFGPKDAPASKENAESSPSPHLP